MKTILYFLIVFTLLSCDKESDKNKVEPAIVIEVEKPPIVIEPPVEEHYINVYWSAPLERVNGDLISLDEIGGYEIRYSLVNSDIWTTVVLLPSVNNFLIDDVDPSLIIEIAVFDADGIYSDFVRIIE